jgi:hypothetical protein
MAILTKGQATSPRGVEVEYTLNSSDLINNVPKVLDSNFYSQVETWDTVTINYKSYFGQVFNLVFKVNQDDYSIEPIGRTVPDLYVGNPQVVSISISDNANGNLLLRRSEIPSVEDLDIDTGIEDAPDSEVLSHNAGVVTLANGEASNWESGFKARFYHPMSSTYLPDTYTLNTINTMNDEVTFNEVLDFGAFDPSDLFLRFAPTEELTLEQLTGYSINY